MCRIGQCPICTTWAFSLVETAKARGGQSIRPKLQLVLDVGIPNTSPGSNHQLGLVWVDIVFGLLGTKVEEVRSGVGGC